MESRALSNDTADILRFSLVANDMLDMFRHRSNSTQIPSLLDLAYCLDFVPKLKYLIF